MTCMKQRWWQSAILSGAMWACPLLAHAATIAWSDAVARVATLHPDPQALESSASAIRARAAQALSPASPQVFVGRTDTDVAHPFTKTGGTAVGASLNFAFPGKAFVQRNNLRAQADALSSDAQSKRVELVTALANVYSDAAATHHLMGILREEIGRLETLQPIIEEQIRVGQGMETDALGTRVARANLEVELRETEANAAALDIQFRTLVQEPANGSDTPRVNPHTLDTPPLPALDHLLALQNRAHPALAAIAAHTQSAHAALTSAKMAVLPDFSVSGQVNNFHDPAQSNLPGHQQTYSFNAGMSVPLFFPFNERAGMRAARHDVAAAMHQQQSIVHTLAGSLAADRAEYLALCDEIHRLTSIVIPAARENFGLIRTSYTLGKTDYLRLSDARVAWLQAEHVVVAKLQTRAAAYHRIIQDVGCDFHEVTSPISCHGVE